MNRENNRAKKIVAITFAVLAVACLLGFGGYVIASKIQPLNTNEPSNQRGVRTDETAEKNITTALNAEEKNKFDDAKNLYSSSLEYYESKTNQSLTDKNNIENIKARLNAISMQEAENARLKSEAKPIVIPSN